MALKRGVIGLDIEADTFQPIAMIAVGPKNLFHSFATGSRSTKVPQGHYLFQTIRPFDSVQCIRNDRGHIYLFFFD